MVGVGWGEAGKGGRWDRVGRNEVGGTTHGGGKLRVHARMEGSCR